MIIAAGELWGHSQCFTTPRPWPTKNNEALRVGEMVSPKDERVN